jgi:hypothetical protein
VVEQAFIETDVPGSEVQVIALHSESSEERLSDSYDEDRKSELPYALDVFSSALAEEKTEYAEEASSIEPFMIPVESNFFIIAESTAIETDVAAVEHQALTRFSDSAEEGLCGSVDDDRQTESWQPWYVSSSSSNEGFTEWSEEESFNEENSAEPLMIIAQPEPLIDRALDVVEMETQTVEAGIFTLCDRSDEESLCDSADDDQQTAQPEQATELWSKVMNDKITECSQESFEIQGIEVVVDIPREMLHDSVHMKEEQVLKSAGVLAAQVLKEHRELTSDPGSDPFLLWDDIRKLLAERLQKEGRGAGHAVRLAVL